MNADASASGRTILLGPQRFLTTAGDAVRSLGMDGPVATVTAGWQDRESEDAELGAVIDGRARNLHLYARLMDTLDTDPRYAAAALAHRQALDELAGVYSLRLQRSLESVYAVQRRPVAAVLAASAFEDGIRAVRAVDAWYLAEVDRLAAELDAAAPAAESEPIRRHRQEVAAILADATAVAVAGGHVGVLLRCLKLFAVIPVALPVVAWSAGAMALTETVVLYSDRGPQGVVGAEVWDRGLGRIRGVVAMPHARRRLRMDDQAVLSVFVRRFGHARCLLLDDGARVEPDETGQLPADARVLTVDGVVGTAGMHS